MNSVVEKLKAFHHPFPSNAGVYSLVFHRLWMVVYNVLPADTLKETLHMEPTYYPVARKLNPFTFPKHAYESAWNNL